MKAIRRIISLVHGSLAANCFAVLLLGAFVSTPAAWADEAANSAKIKARDDAQKALDAADRVLKDLGTKPVSLGDPAKAKAALTAATVDRTQKETARNAADN